jgi:DNA-binding CsgD family transcriptional regulator
VSAVDAPSLPITAIYDAALDGSKWPAALAAAARYIGGSSASLWIRNPGVPAGDHYHFGDEDDCPARGLAWSHAAAPRHAERELALVEQAATSRGAFLEARLRGQAAAEASGGGDGVAYLSVFRRDGSWDAEARRRLRLIVPHFSRAVEMIRLMTIRYAAALAMADTLDSLDASVFLVDANGETVHANTNGEARLAEGRLVRSVRGKLTASAPEAAAALGQAVKYRRAAKFAFTVPGEHRDGAGGGCQIGRLFPLAAEVARDRGCHRPVVAGLVLDDTALDASKPVDRIAQHYGLARSERDVLLTVVDGCGLTEAAETLSISHSTLKTYLRRLFEKTGTRRQMDLIRLCAAFHSPFRDRR